MVELLRFNRAATTVFDLLGSQENDQTFSLGFVLSRSPQLLAGFIEAASGVRVDGFDSTTVALQRSERESGRTDIEINVPNRFFGVIEAKIGPNFPGEQQLARYGSMIARQRAPRKLLCAVTNLSTHLAGLHVSRLPEAIREIPFTHVSWRQVRDLAKAARQHESHTNKRWLEEFITYLGEILGMDRRYSNMTYVVSLAQGNREGWTLSWRDVVNESRRQFYPVHGCPEPPHSFGFGFGGKL